MTGTNHEIRPGSAPSGQARRRLFRMLTLLVALAVVWLAVRPSTGMTTGLPWDKANHAAAFLVLTVLTGCGWPGIGLWRMAMLMLAAGIGIELVQGLPAVGRDADVVDVVADLVGMTLGWMILGPCGFRRRMA